MKYSWRRCPAWVQVAVGTALVLGFFLWQAPTAWAQEVGARGSWTLTSPTLAFWAIVESGEGCAVGRGRVGAAGAPSYGPAGRADAASLWGRNWRRIAMPLLPWL